jgi:hypothetical protein
VFSATPAAIVARLHGRRSAACWCKLESPKPVCRSRFRPTRFWRQCKECSIGIAPTSNFAALGLASRGVEITGRPISVWRRIVHAFAVFSNRATVIRTREPSALCAAQRSGRGRTETEIFLTSRRKWETRPGIPNVAFRSPTIDRRTMSHTAYPSLKTISVFVTKKATRA